MNGYETAVPLPDNLYEQFYHFRHRFINDQTSSGMNQKSGRVFEKLGHFPKTRVRVWQDRLFPDSQQLFPSCGDEITAS
jgi:hypothetical protein